MNGHIKKYKQWLDIKQTLKRDLYNVDEIFASQETNPIEKRLYLRQRNAASDRKLEQIEEFIFKEVKDD